MSRVSFASKLKGLDLFGEQVNFTINNGLTSLGTWRGLFMSFLIWSILVIYAQDKLLGIVDYEDVDHTTETASLANNSTLDLGESGVEFFLTLRYDKNTPIDKSLLDERTL
jgi:hypothetical protein